MRKLVPKKKKRGENDQERNFGESIPLKNSFDQSFFCQKCFC